MARESTTGGAMPDAGCTGGGWSDAGIGTAAAAMSTASRARRAQPFEVELMDLGDFLRGASPSQGSEAQERTGSYTGSGVGDGVASEDGWTIFPGCDAGSCSCGVELVSMPCANLDVCKGECLSRGWGGFVLDKGVVIFHACSQRELLRSARRRSAIETHDRTPASVPTLLVVPRNDQAALQQGWIEGMEANLILLRRMAERHRHARDAAEARGDQAGALAAGRDLERAKEQIAQMATALWQAMSDTFGYSGSGGYAAVNAHVLEPGGAVGAVSEADSDVKAAGSMAATWKIGAPSATVAATAMCPSERLGDAINGCAKGSGYLTSSGGKDEIARPQEEVGITRSSLTEGARILEAAGGQGAGKGSQGMPPPPGKGKSKGYSLRMKSPIGRNFHWRSLGADKLHGTIFDDESCPAVCLAAAPELAVLQRLFQADDAEQLAARGGSARRRSSLSVGPRAGEVCVLTRARAQHISIVLRRVFGVVPKEEDMERLSEALETLALPLFAGESGRQLDAEDLELLSTALPTVEEAADISAAPLGELRRTEALLLPFVIIPSSEARLRILRLATQAAELQAAPLARVSRIATACCELRKSTVLRLLLRAVAQLGSWINSADLGLQRGFALSSALGKLRQFRALRGDRGLSLLHVAAVAAAGGKPANVGALGEQLASELILLPQASKEDLSQLGQAVSNFRAEADWLTAEATRACGPDGYTEDAMARLQVHRDTFAVRAAELSKAWATSRAELESLLFFFAERWDPTVGIEVAAENLFKTVEEFRAGFCLAAREVDEQPERFAKVYAAIPNDVGWDLSREPSSGEVRPLLATPATVTARGPSDAAPDRRRQVERGKRGGMRVRPPRQSSANRPRTQVVGVRTGSSFGSDWGSFGSDLHRGATGEAAAASGRALGPTEQFTTLQQPLRPKGI